MATCSSVIYLLHVSHVHLQPKISSRRHVWQVWGRTRIRQISQPQTMIFTWRTAYSDTNVMTKSPVNALDKRYQGSRCVSVKFRFWKGVPTHIYGVEKWCTFSNCPITDGVILLRKFLEICFPIAPYIRHLLMLAFRYDSTFFMAIGNSGCCTLCYDLKCPCTAKPIARITTDPIYTGHFQQSWEWWTGQK